MNRQSSQSTWFARLALAVMVVLAYSPAWNAGFIWDDDVYVTENKLLTAPDGLRRIWFSQDSPSQYFPLVYTSFRFEHALWGLSPEGYHWVNLILHACNAILVWTLLKRLAVPGAWLGACLFALHPVQVETVAWVTERKNVLALLFYLLSLLSWIGFLKSSTPRSESQPKPDAQKTAYKHAPAPPSPGGEGRPALRSASDEGGGEGERPMPQGDSRFLESGSGVRALRRYLLALGFFALALFSKTTACTLPAALMLVLWLRHEPITRRRWLQVMPFLGLGLCMGLVTSWWERHHIGTSGGVFQVGLLERVLIASRGVWFYLWKLIWPVNLTFSYPRWTIDPSQPLAYGWLLLCALATGLIYWARRFAGRGPETAVAFFVATLSPTLGFIMLFTFRYTFVADHYQYVACIGPLALAAAGLTIGFQRFVRAPQVVGATLGTVLALGLAGLTWSQARAYRSAELLWRDTVAKNPESWMAYGNLGRLLMHRGQFDSAMAQYKEALRINPRDIDSLVSVGNALFGKGLHDQAMDYYMRALRINPDNPEAHVNLAVILANRGQVAEAIEHDRQAIRVNSVHVTAHVNLAVMLASTGRFEEAMEHYRTALEISPDQPLTHINMAIALEGLGRKPEADEHYHTAAMLANRHAALLAQQGRISEAMTQYAEAIRMIPNNAEAHFELGVLLLRQDKRAEAREHFAEAVHLKPTFEEARRQLQSMQTRQ